MSKDTFVEWQPRTKLVKTILAAGVQIIGEYAAQGYHLTLRQLYYRLVARDLMPNNYESYRRLGRVVNDARLGGWIEVYPRACGGTYHSPDVKRCGHGLSPRLRT